MPVCPSCKDQVDPDSELCLNCGEPLDPVQLKAQGKPVPPPAPAAVVKAAAPPQRATVVGTPAARRRREEEPVAVRCKGCGVPSTAERCPGCGGILRRD
jgi:hypothetical protein